MSRRAALGAAVGLTLALAGCASADKTTASGSAGGSTAAMTMSHTSKGASGAGAVAGSNASMSSMNMASGTTTIVSADGVRTPVPIRTIGTGSWKDMAIRAQEMTPVPFYIYTGQGFREIKPTKQTSFHLMVMLTDRHTGVAIPYATVWAVVSRDGKRIFNERQWDMLSEYMGPHYGNDVTLPGPGTYQLKLFVSAPVAALHSEYDNMWSGEHTVTSTFTWK
jgi:hypothetical protein